MENKDQAMIKNVILSMHQVASDHPEMLDAVLTNPVLTWTITDLDQKMQQTSKILISEKEISSFKNSSSKEFNEDLIVLNERTLLSYYKLYKRYEQIMLSRNIDIEIQTDITIVENLLPEDGLLEITAQRNK